MICYDACSQCVDGIVAYQDAADAVLSAAKTSMPRLVGVIAYYPSVIPDPTRTTYPPGLHVLLHTCGQNINVERRPEVLGIQGKPKIVEKELPNGSGVGQEIHLKQAAMKRSVVDQGDFRLYNYPGCETGFSESDLDEFDESARNIAWSRSLRLARAAFGIVDDYSLEAIRDAFVDDVKAGRKDPKTVPLWVNGRLMTVHAALYYHTISTYSQKNIKLVSRTTGADQVVDELEIDLVDGTEDWMAPPVSNNATTNKIRLVSMTTIRAGQPIREKVLWYDA